MPWLCLQSGMLQSTMACPEGAAVPRVQVVPVLLCSGQGAALVLHCSQLADEPAAQGQDVSVLLQPVCLWCTLPLVARLQAFGASVAQHLMPAAATAETAEGATAAPQAVDGSGNRQQEQEQTRLDAGPSDSKAAVAAAIANILQQQERGEQQLGEQQQQQQEDARYGCAASETTRPSL